MRTAPQEAGPGLPRAAPSVRTTNPVSFAAVRRSGRGSGGPSTSPNDSGSAVTPGGRSIGVPGARGLREHRQLGARLRGRIAAPELPPGPLEGVVELVGDTLLQRDDRVVGD